MKSGNLITIQDNFKNSIDLIIEVKSNETCSFSLVSNPFEKLIIQQNGNIAFKTTEKFSNFKIDLIDDSNRSVSIKHCSSKRYLCFNNSKELHSQTDIYILNLMTKMESPVFTIINHENSDYLLKNWEFQRFLFEGYLHLKNIIPSSSIHEVNRFLNCHLGQPNSLVPGGIQGNGFGKFDGGISNDKLIKSLFTRKLQGIIGQFMGNENSIDNTTLHPQIAFRFPELNGSRSISNDG
jgi:hypothetical protein